MENKLLGLPAGFRDVLFDEAKTRRIIEGKLAALFSAEGFREVSPSGVEFLELYARGNQNSRGRAVKFLDRDDHLLALRADFTPAIARLVSTRLATAPPPLKVWYAGNVFRKVDQKHGRFCEFGQIGAELIGLNSVERDAEIINLGMHALSSLGIKQIRIHINHAGIFRGIVGDLALDEKSLDLVKSEIDRKDIRGLLSRLQTLGIAPETRAQVSTLSTCVGSEEVLRTAAAAMRNDESRRAIDALVQLSSRLERWRDCITFDLAEIDEMEYYSGVMFTFFNPQLTSELGMGGRYDTLLREFGADMPAIGFSFSIDRLIESV